MVGSPSLFDAPGMCLLLLLIGGVFGGLGLVLALDFRGLTTRHVDATFRLMRPVENILRRVPPWRQFLRRPAEGRMRQQVAMERLTGVAFGVLRLLSAALGVIGLVGWAAS